MLRGGEGFACIQLLVGKPLDVIKYDKLGLNAGSAFKHLNKTHCILQNKAYVHQVCCCGSTDFQSWFPGTALSLPQEEGGLGSSLHNTVDCWKAVICN